VRRVKGRYRSTLEQEIVERDRELAVYGWPVVLVRGNNDDGAVETHLLAIVLANVRVVPIHARIREREAVREGAVHGNGLLCCHGAVIPVVEAQPMPVHGRLEIAAIGGVDDERRSLLNPEGGSRNRAVVG
jgi:hypothetical protein